MNLELHRATRVQILQALVQLKHQAKVSNPYIPLLKMESTILWVNYIYVVAFNDIHLSIIYGYLQHAMIVIKDIFLVVVITNGIVCQLAVKKSVVNPS